MSFKDNLDLSRDANNGSFQIYLTLSYNALKHFAKKFLLLKRKQKNSKYNSSFLVFQDCILYGFNFLRGLEWAEQMKMGKEKK